jgi:hypothetical protein
MREKVVVKDKKGEAGGRAIRRIIGLCLRSFRWAGPRTVVDQESDGEKDVIVFSEDCFCLQSRALPPTISPYTAGVNGTYPFPSI